MLNGISEKIISTKTLSQNSKKQPVEMLGWKVKFQALEDWNLKGHTGIPGLWTQELDSGRWTLSLTVVEQNQNPVSDFG